MTSSILTLDKINVVLGGARILHEVTSSVASEGVTGLVGQNGSGKSTLLRVLARQQIIVSGRATLDGAALTALSDRQFARRVAYLPQQLPAASGLTVRELVGLGRYAWHGALGRFSIGDAQHVDRALDLMGLDSFANRFVDSLSGGERQRVWLAMLIAQDARVLLLDEPLSALDVVHQSHVLRLIRRIVDRRAVGVVIVVHDLNLAARHCDRLIALKGGRLVADGPPSEIMSPAVLSRIYDAPMGVVDAPGAGGPIAFVRDMPAEDPTYA